MYAQFTDHARAAFHVANQQAQRFNHEYVGVEHMLLGLVKEHSGMGARVLGELKFDLRRIWLAVERLMQSGPEMVTMGNLPQTPRLKKVLEHAAEEAQTLKSEKVGTEHILLGLLREEEGIPTQVFDAMGITLQAVRARISQLANMGLEGDDQALAEVRSIAQELDALRKRLIPLIVRRGLDANAADDQLFIGIIGASEFMRLARQSLTSAL